jgi:putative oligomerization/nucleic acid binding protein
MPGLLRGVARTAVVAGTATAVANRVSRRQGGRWARQEAVTDTQEAAENGDAMLARLHELGELRSRGVLTEAEFEAQKSRILNG